MTPEGRANHMKTTLNRLRAVNVSDRQAVTLFVATLVAFVLLVAAMLSVTTSTARANRELDRLNGADRTLQTEITDLWTTIGKETAADRMATRARQKGYAPAANVEHLVFSATVSSGQAITPTR